MIYIRHTISKISFSYIMYITIILCRNYLQIVRSNYVYFGQINESVCLSVCLSLYQLFIHTKSLCDKALHQPNIEMQLVKEGISMCSFFIVCIVFILNSPV